ncbi:MAG: hypothetical protein ABSB88_18755 [Bryobacteraceae bacterium]|jgi:hypothetical protein
MSSSTTRDIQAWEDQGGAAHGPRGIRAAPMRRGMTDPIAAGSILIREGMTLPESLLLQSESDLNGWAAVRTARSTFEKELQEAGWTWFFLAGEIKTTVFGFDRRKTLRTALRRLIAKVTSQHCNSIEIAQVTSNSFLKVPYVSVSAHPRHLQKGLTFSGQR